MLDLKKLADKLDKALESETQESILGWLKSHSNFNEGIDWEYVFPKKTFIEELPNLNSFTYSKWIQEVVYSRLEFSFLLQDFKYENGDPISDKEIENSDYAMAA